MKFKSNIIIAILLLSLSAAPAHAIALWEKLAYRKDIIKLCNAKVLVNPLTHEIKYMWYENVLGRPEGKWVPVIGMSKLQFQAMYDQQNGK